MSKPDAGSASNLVEALVAIGDAPLWRQYCRLAVQLEHGGTDATPAFAPGSVEWQQQDRSETQPESTLSAATEAAGHRRLAQRGAPLPFAGAPSPLGPASNAAFDDFIARHRGSSALLAEIAAVEQRLIDGFEAAGRAGRFQASGFRDGARRELDPDWFGRARLDFAQNSVVLPDGSVIAGIEVTLVPARVAGGAGGERAARAMLRRALVALWERGEFTAGTGNERVLALALRELGLSASDPPYGFKSAETVRKLRKTLNMSL
jgi:hypothetical protein